MILSALLGSSLFLIPTLGCDGELSTASIPQDPIKTRKVTGAGGSNPWFKETKKDLGSYFKNETAKGEFKFKNPNQYPVTLERLAASCQCSTAVIKVGSEEWRLTKTPQPNTLYKVSSEDGREILDLAESILVPPGAEGVVEVELQMQNTQGKRTAYLDINTNDKATPHMKLQFEAVGASLFQIQPNEFNLGKMTWTDSRNFQFRITSPIAKDFEITGHDDLPDGFTIEYDKKMQGELAVWTVKGTFGKLEQERSGGGILKVHTNAKGNQKIPLRVHAIVQGPITMEPGGFLSLGLIRKGKGATRSIRITPTDDFDLKAEDVVLGNLSIDESLIKVTPRKDGKVLVLDVEISKDVKPGKLVRGDLTVKLNHPAVAEKKFLFNGFVR